MHRGATAPAFPAAGDKRRGCEALPGSKRAAGEGVRAGGTSPAGSGRPGGPGGRARALTGVQVSAQCACTDQCPESTVSACARQMAASASSAASGTCAQLLPQPQQPAAAAPSQAGYSSPTNGSTVRRRGNGSPR